MKKLSILVLFQIFISHAYSQSDTLFNKKKEQIVCKIIEIGESEIRYYLYNQLEGPLYVVSKSSLFKYTLSNGETKYILPDELFLENEHETILNNRTAIKIHPFSLVNHQITLGYEKVIKVGMNLDTEFGYVNSGINQAGIFGNNLSKVSYSGTFIKPGMKFFIGQDYAVKGLKYAHPLKGRYVKLDLAFCYLNYQNMVGYIYAGQYPSVTQQSISTASNIFSYGGFVNYGRQIILANTLIMDVYVGAGYTGFNYNYTNPEYVKNLSNRSFNGDNLPYTMFNFHGYLRVPRTGLSFTAGFRIGYILPEKKVKHAATKKEKLD